MEIDKETQALVTVITPLFNAEKYITETIESVINQTYQNWEMIIVDDFSSDNSRNIVKKYEIKDSRIKLMKSESNFGGPARPRNIGLDNANGEYIAFLDADDVWLPNKLERQVELLGRDSSIDIVHSLAYTIDTRSKKIGVFNNQKTFNKLKYIMSPMNILLISNYININTVLMRNNSDVKFREDKFLVALEDWAFWIDNKFSSKKEYLINEYFINYRVDINSISNRGTDKSYRKAYFLYALLFNEGKISFKRYLLNSIFNTIKVIIKNIKMFK